MKGIAYWAVGSGVVVIVLAATYPFIMEWQMQQTLARYGAEHLASEAAKEMLQDRIWSVLMAFALGCVSVVAGVLLLRRKKLGWTLWLSVCGFFVGFAVVDFIRTGDILAPAVRALWWITVLVVSLLVFKRGGYAQRSRLDDTART